MCASYFNPVVLFATVVTIDAMDVSGEQQIDVDHNIFKQRLNSSGDIINDTPEKESKSKVFLVLHDRFDNVIFTYF